MSAGFQFIGGDLGLDFVNTADRPKGGPVVEQDKLVSPEALIEWAKTAGIASDDDVRKWRSEELAPLLGDAYELREAMFRIFYAHALGDRAKDSHLEVLNRVLREAARNSEIAERGGQFRKEWKNASDPRRILWQVAESAARLLTSSALERVKFCSSDTCRWLFVDSTKNHTRRWCEMRSCGNRAKVRRYLQKHS